MRAADPLRAQAVAAMPGHWRRPETAPPASRDLAIWPAAPTASMVDTLPTFDEDYGSEGDGSGAEGGSPDGERMEQVGPAAPDRSRNPPAALMALQVSKARDPRQWRHGIRHGYRRPTHRSRAGRHPRPAA